VLKRVNQIRAGDVPGTRTHPKAKRARALLKAAEDAGMTDEELMAIINKRAKKHAA
jgi:hypothetical protein